MASDDSSDSSGTDTGQTDTTGQSDTSGGTGGDSSSGGVSGIATSIVNALIAPIKAIVDEIEAKSANTLNQILNTGAYAGIAGWGIFMMLVGFVILIHEASNGDASVGGVLKSAGGKVKGLALGALTVAEPELGAPVAAASKVASKAGGAAKTVAKPKAGGSLKPRNAEEREVVTGSKNPDLDLYNHRKAKRSDREQGIK